jgi:hypothetical protein
MLVPTGWLRKGLQVNLGARARCPRDSRRVAGATLYFFSAPKIFRASHIGATNTCAGLVRNAGLFPSIRCPSQAKANAVGIKNSATIQCHQITIREEKPTGIAIMWRARLTGWL